MSGLPYQLVSLRIPAPSSGLLVLPKGLASSLARSKPLIPNTPLVARSPFQTSSDRLTLPRRWERYGLLTGRAPTNSRGWINEGKPHPLMQLYPRPEKPVHPPTQLRACWVALVPGRWAGGERMDDQCTLPTTTTYTNSEF